jgi:hypothetical protein
MVGVSGGRGEGGGGFGEAGEAERGCQQPLWTSDKRCKRYCGATLEGEGCVLSTAVRPGPHPEQLGAAPPTRTIAAGARAAPAPSHLHPAGPVEALPKVAPRAAASQGAVPVVGAGRGGMRPVAPQLGGQVLVDARLRGRRRGAGHAHLVGTCVCACAGTRACVRACVCVCVCVCVCGRVRTFEMRVGGGGVRQQIRLQGKRQSFA